MEAANPKRAALRLAGFGLGVLLTLGMAVATVLLAKGPQDESVEPRVADADGAPAIDFEPDSASYRLPLEDEPAIETTPVSASPSWRLPSRHAPMPETPAYEAPPAELAVAAPRAPAEPVAAPSPTPVGGWSGPLTIHNPAAMGPPEEDLVPPIPTPRGPARVAARPEGPLALAPPAVAEPQAEGPEASYEPVASMPYPLATTPIELAPPAAPAGPSWAELLASEPERPLRELADPDTEALESYTASTTDLSRRLEPEVQAGFQLGKSGAVFAARAKFVEVLRRIALAKDAATATTAHSEALAEGLRTLDEADDFVPKGNTLEAELDVDAIARSHGVRLASAERAVAPHEAVARYSQHAAVKLAEAVAGEQAGSMALYGLGKTYDRLEAQGGDTTAGRKSAVMYRAAIDAHAENYLAANELGVRLAKSGRYEQASRVLRRAASQPAAIAAVHANLAAVESRLGRDQAAAMAQRQGHTIAQQERMAGAVSRRHGVEWVDQQTFRQAPLEPAMAPPAGAPLAAATPPPTPEPGGISGLWRSARRATGWEPAPVTTTAARPAAPTQRVVR